MLIANIINQEAGLKGDRTVGDGGSRGLTIRRERNIYEEDEDQEEDRRQHGRALQEEHK